MIGSIVRAAGSLCICLHLGALLQADQTIAPAEFRTVEEVAQLFRQRCAKCHGPLKPEGKLNLSTLRGLSRGGESGALISPGKPDESLLWERVSADEMPPKHPLTADEKTLLRRWIESGAPGLPAGAPGPVVGADHWAFQPLTKRRPPEVRDHDKVRTESDCYLQRELEQRGLSLGPDADRSTLIRRVSLDLTGLPPTPDEVAAFVADPASDAYEQLVERCLSSRHFGERWGKHWLDAAGYADSNGYFSADTDRPWAFRYRDYVIRSLNADKPFDQFVLEQLAGDELATFSSNSPTTPETIDVLTATHFLRNGQDGTDIGVQEPEAFEIDRRAALEAAVQVTASSLLGLTLHCARCHAHKFEPITQEEYYQFQAVLFPAFNPQDWINPKDRVVYAQLPGEKEAWETNERRLTAELKALRNEFETWLSAHREPSEVLLHEPFDDTWQSRWSNTAPGDDAPGGTIAFDKTTANSARTEAGSLQILAGPEEAWLSTTKGIDWTPEEKGDWVQATFDLVANQAGGPVAMRIGYSIAVHDFDGSSSRRGGNLLIDGNPSEATSIYGDYPGGAKAVRGAIGQQGYVSGRNYGVRVTNQGEGKFLLEHLVDGLPDGKPLELSVSDLPDGGFAFFYSSSRSYVVDNVRIERSLPKAGERPEVAALRKESLERRAAYEKQRGSLEAQRAPAPGRAIAWVTDKSTQAPVVPFLTRGLYHQRGPSVEPGALRILTDPENEYRPEPRPGEPATTGRRLGFAKWLTRPKSRPAALLARTYVNRVWQQYFGRGIVPTTDNLGLGGAPPSHPELLDHLATFFIESGWSTKALHREIALSSAYRQSSAPRTDGLSIDPDNRSLWRFPVRRLQAEVIRDAILAASGQLDPTPYGPYVPSVQTAVGEVIADQKHAGSRRRSIYLQQRRSQTLSMLRVFDAPSVATICTTRPSSTVPLQSLMLLNSEFSLASGEAFARRLLRETDRAPESLVRRAWLVALSRAPTPEEEAIALEFLAAQMTQYAENSANESALADFCQMLLASNSFLYVE